MPSCRAGVEPLLQARPPEGTGHGWPVVSVTIRSLERFAPPVTVPHGADALPARRVDAEVRDRREPHRPHPWICGS